MDGKAFDEIMASLDAPLVVVTTAVDEERGGCLIGFHAQSSISPDRYTLWISKANHTYRLALRATHLAVHFLTADDLEVARLFGTTTGDDIDKFAHCEHETGPYGVPLLTGCPNRLVVRRTALLDEGGDHVCVATEALSASTSGRFTPLRLSDVDDLVPGHDADERPAPPTERATGPIAGT